MKNNNLAITFALLLPFLLLSCSQESGTEQTQAPPTVSLDPLSFAEWEDQLGEYQGNIVVADLWAMWCAPCIKRFPKMVDLHHQYAGQDVTFISINFDDRNDGEALQKAESFLNEKQAVFDNFYFSENLIDAFERMEVIALPVVVIYDQNGQEAVRLTNTDPNNQFTGADIESAIEKLLAAN